MTLRRFSDVAREEGEISAGAQYTGDRFALRLQATAVSNASDGKDFRADGSYAGVVLGNWMLSAGYIDRWWGPGWEGSLIYGTNARPIPSVTIERNYSDAVENPWFSWIGQWRLAVTMGELEGNRDDAPHAKFFGMRATWKPHPRLEVGISRSAQWCGEGRPCDAGTFWDLLTGNDNDQPLARTAGQPDGRLRPALVAALGAGRGVHAGDRRGRGEFHAEQVPRPVRRGGLGRMGRALVARACGVCGYDLRVLQEPAAIRLCVPQ